VKSRKQAIAIALSQAQEPLDVEEEVSGVAAPLSTDK
jgi:hypothetical protein